MVIYRDVEGAKIVHKIWHVHKIGGRVHKDYTVDCGDVPVAVINKVTGKIEEVENHRGNAYALRRAKRYRKRKSCRVLED